MAKGQIAIIPARGGSKRLPRKNILQLNDHPMIGYPIRAALNSNLFDEVIVSTEDEEIKEIAASYGATVISRPHELAKDRSTVVEVCTHILSLNEYKAVDFFCCIYATAAFLKSIDLFKARKHMDEEPVVDYVMGVSTYNYPPVQALRENEGYLTYMWPEFCDKQSQEYPKLVVSNGTFYWARTDYFREDKSFYGRRMKGYQLSAVDIDTLNDYEHAKNVAVERMLKIE